MYKHLCSFLFLSFSFFAVPQTLAATENPTVMPSEKSFMAISIEDIDAAINWFTHMFDAKMLSHREIPNGRGSVALLKADNLLVELVSLNGSTLPEGAREGSRANIQGFFKTGLFVSDIMEAHDRLESKNATFRGQMFHDRTFELASFLIEGPEGHVIQFFGPVPDSETK